MRGSVPSGERRRGPGRRRRSRTQVATAVVLSIAAAVVLVVVATGGAVMAGPWNIDGTVPDGGALTYPDPVGSVKELGPLNGVSTKLGVIHSAPTPMLGFTDVTPGLDLSALYLGTANENGDPWLYLGWRREASSTGQITFELHQDGLPSGCDLDGVPQEEQTPQTSAQQALIAGCNPWAGRKAGDVLLVWDQQGQTITLGRRVFDGTSWGSLVSLSSSSFEADTSEDGLAGEAGIDLVAAGIFPREPEACLTFANVIAGTITGNSDQADYKDTVLADTSAAGISTCGTVTVEKVTVPDGAEGQFGYALARESGGSIRYDGTTQVTGTLTFGGDVDTIADLKPREDYTLSESVPKGWTLTSIVCTHGEDTFTLYPVGGQEEESVVNIAFDDDEEDGPPVAELPSFPVEANSVTECVIENTRDTTLTLVKNVVNDNGGTALPAAWGLTAGGQAATMYKVTSGTTATVPPGSYALAETAGPAGYAFSGWSCTGASLQGTTVTLAQGAQATCTATNDDIAPALVVVKHVVNDEGGEASADDFDLQVTGQDASPASFAGSEEGTKVTLDAGAYSVDEAAAEGYRKTIGEGCSGTIALGETRTCTITNDDDPAPAIEVEKTATPASRPEPGGVFTFTVTLRNTGPERLFVGALTDTVGETTRSLDGVGSCDLDELVLEPAGTAGDADEYTCQFDTTFEGSGGSSQTDTVEVTAYDDEEQSVKADDSATIRITAVPSTITLVKTATPGSLTEPGGQVTFTFVIANPLQFTVDGDTVTSVHDVFVSRLVDSVFGDLTEECELVEVILAPGQSVVCQIVRTVTGTVATPHVNTATVTGFDERERELTATDDATVTFTAPPPPTPPADPVVPVVPVEPTIDLQAQKAATAQARLTATLNQAAIVYNVAFVNRGPSVATGVQAVDPAPTGVTFLTVTQQPTQGSCAVTGGGAALECSLGDLQPGQSVAAVVTARVSSSGTFTNTVTVSGGGGRELNPADNTAQASTLVLSPLTPPVSAPTAKPKARTAVTPKAKAKLPPTPKPKPKVKPKAAPKPVPVCSTLTVAQQTLKANGDPQVVNAVVRKGGKAVAGARVVLTGPGLSLVARTGSDGRVRIPVKPLRAGIVKVAIVNGKACNTQRIGVVAVFEPPVTG